MMTTCLRDVHNNIVTFRIFTRTYLCKQRQQLQRSLIYCCYLIMTSCRAGFLRTVHYKFRIDHDSICHVRRHSWQVVAAAVVLRYTVAHLNAALLLF